VNPAAVVADPPAVFDRVAGDLVKDRKHRGSHLAGRVEFAVVHVGQRSTGKEHPSAAAVQHGVAVNDVMSAIQVQPESIPAYIFDVAVFNAAVTGILQPNRRVGMYARFDMPQREGGVTKFQAVEVHILYMGLLFDIAFHIDNAV